MTMPVHSRRGISVAPSSARRHEMADQSPTKILGDIEPDPKRSRTGVLNSPSRVETDRENEDEERAAEGASQEDRTKRAGSRDVTEGTTGGTGTEVGGTRNLRTGPGATGTDIGNQPE
jgi:hypothetical protein